MSKKSVSELLPRQTLDVPRPDLSAKEAWSLVVSRLRSADLEISLAGIALAGRGNLDGRIEPRVGGWQFLFYIDQNRLAEAWLYFNGNFGADYVRRPFFEQAPPRIEEPWIDSTAAAEAVSVIPIVSGVESKDSLFLRITQSKERRFWEVWRSAYSSETKMERKHEFLVDARTANVAFEKFTLSKGTSVFDTWQRLREG